MRNLWKKSIIIVVFCLIAMLVWKKQSIAKESHSLTIKNPYTSATVSGEWNGTLEDSEADKLATDTGKEVCFVANVKYGNDDKIGEKMSGEILQIDTPEKCNVSIEVTGLKVEQTVKFNIFGTEDAKEKIWEDPDITQWLTCESVGTGETKSFLYARKKKGTHYLVVKSDSRNSEFSNDIQIKITCYVTKEMKLETGKWYAIGAFENLSLEPVYDFTIDADANVTFETTESVWFHLESKEIPWDQVPRKSNQTSEKYDYKKTYSLEKGTYQFVPELIGDMKAGFLIRIIVEKHTSVLKENKWKTIYPVSDYPAHVYKIVPKSNGYITITLKNETGYDTSAKIHLRDKRSYWMSPSMNINSKKEHMSEIVFAVKKGQVYYLNLYNGKDKIAFKYMFTKVKENAGKSIQSAKTVKRNKQVTGTVLGDITSRNEADWYKINLNKTKKLKITIKGASSKKLKAIIYDKKGKTVGTIGCIADGKLRETVWKSKNKLSKGSYYVKIYPGYECATGCYSLKWK